jgi:hypothetical protein
MLNEYRYSARLPQEEDEESQRAVATAVAMNQPRPMKDW